MSKKSFVSFLTIGTLLSLLLTGCTSAAGKPNTSGTALFGVSAEVIEVIENGRCEVKVIGEDENFAKDDVIIINYNYVNGIPENGSLKMGDIIAITYSSFEKVGTVYEITTSEIEAISNID